MGTCSNQFIGNIGIAETAAVPGGDTLNTTGGQRRATRRLRPVAKLEVSPEIIRLLPAEFVKRHCLLPLAVRNGTLHIATAAPGNQRVIDDIRLLSGLGSGGDSQRPPPKSPQKSPSATR